MCMRACTCMMYLQKLGGGGRREGLKAGDKHEEGESTSLA